MSLSRSYFEHLYGHDEDPWGLSSRWYEQRKYQLTVASLSRMRYHSGFEPGCSIGVLTELLAQRCDRLLAMDISASCLATASRRNLGDGVSLREGAIPTDWPEVKFDLIVLSEIAYYLSREDLNVVIERSIDSLTPDGNLLAVHWRQRVEDYPLSASEVHEALCSTAELRPIGHYHDTFFLLDLFSISPSGDLEGPE